MKKGICHLNSFTAIAAATGLVILKRAAAQAPEPIFPSPITSITSLAGTATAPLTIFVKWFIGIFWVITVGFIIWAAFLYLTAGGNEEKITEAKKRLTYAVIAGAIALLSTGIDLIVYYLLKGSSV